MKKNFMKNLLIVITSIIVLVTYSCQKEVLKTSTTEDVNISGYLEKYPETYSLLSEILEKSKTEGYLGAYGTYTLFAPVNSAIQTWITDNGKSSLNDFSEQELLNFVKYHVIRDTVSTVRFTDGKIKSPTLFGEYLFTDVVNGSYRINKYAIINKSNILCGNGVIHSLNSSLIPPSKNLAQAIEGNPSYSIFTEALKATGFYDTLYYNRGDLTSPEKRFQTVIVESDSLFNTIGINNFNDLKSRYSTKNDPTNPADSLWLFVAYHISNDGKYLEDIIGSSSIYTLAPKEIISTKYTNNKILLNEDEFNGVFEPGAELNRAKSDITASNGVLHESKNNFSIKVRRQVPVYFDLATSPELKIALGSSYQNGVLPLVNNGKIIASSIEFNNLSHSQLGSHKYDFNINSSTGTRPWVNNDILNLSICAANTARAKYVDIKTPYLVKGRYKVWICYVAANTNSPVLQVLFNPGKIDQQILPNLVDLRSGLDLSGVTTAMANDPNADNLMLAQGYKRYMATTLETNENGVKGIKQVNTTGWNLNAGRLAGIITVETTDRHVIRLDAVSGGCTNNYNWLDMIHFIPADDFEQNYPRFHTQLGELFYRPN